jgi:tetratricopeptide (TPR) repeat protein
MEEIEPDHTMTLTLMGEVLMHLGYFELALAWLMQATEREEAGPYYKLLAAQALYRLRQYEVAAEIIEDCAIQDAADLIEDDWLDLAEIRLELGQVQAAIECMERARATKQTGAWLALWGRAQIASGNEAAGLEALDRALSSYKSEEESTPGTREYNIAWCHAYRAMLARQYGIHLIDVQAERAAACAALIRSCTVSDVSLRYAHSDPCFDPLWNMPELEGLAVEGGRGS